MAGGKNPKSMAVNAALFCASAVVALVLCEGLLRLRYAEPLRAPSPEVLAIQPYLVLHPTLGFTWNPNVDARDNIVFEVKDTHFEALSTDEYGFINHPEAIERRRAGVRVDIVGLGDSFMEHAAHTFYASFEEQGLMYYGMAVHRQSPPQYTAILEEYALPLEPEWVLYGVFENDFMEARDFERWQASGLDWFEFHSGTWCGAPLEPNPLRRVQERYLRGFTGAFRVLQSRLRGDNMSITGPSDEDVARVAAKVIEAHGMAVERHVRFLAVLIPGRGAAVTGTSPESRAFDKLIALLGDVQGSLLDLRGPFSSDSDPASLYYKIDGHWNARGMEKAARAILGRIQSDVAGR